MNPGYAGRSELPDNLKAILRPVSMMVPDFTLIAEIMMFSEGFSSAKVHTTTLLPALSCCSVAAQQFWTDRKAPTPMVLLVGCDTIRWLAKPAFVHVLVHTWSNRAKIMGTKQAAMLKQSSAVLYAFAGAGQEDDSNHGAVPAAAVQAGPLRLWPALLCHPHCQGCRWGIACLTATRQCSCYVHAWQSCRASFAWASKPSHPVMLLTLEISLQTPSLQCLQRAQDCCLCLASHAAHMHASLATLSSSDGIMLYRCTEAS